MTEVACGTLGVLTVFVGIGFVAIAPEARGAVVGGPEILEATVSADVCTDLETGTDTIGSD